MKEKQDAVIAFAIANEVPLEQAQNLNQYQIIALIEFSAFGLNYDLIEKNSWINHTAYISALKRLLINREFTPEQAIARLEGLSPYQADGIAYGLLKEEVIDLNAAQIWALKSLKKIGLTAEILKENPWFSNVFQVNALKHFMLNEKHTLEFALEKIKNLNSYQLNELCKSDLVV